MDSWIKQTHHDICKTSNLELSPHSKTTAAVQLLNQAFLDMTRETLGIKTD